MRFRAGRSLRAGWRLVVHGLGLVAATLSPLRAEAERDPLLQGFLQPPAHARPETWWHWRDGNINPAAITAELEALHRIGIGGVTLFSVQAYGAREGKRVAVLSPEWEDRLRFAEQECARLGLSLTLHNCAGWSTAGGPWITPDKGMHRVVATRHTVQGGDSLVLPSIPSWPESGKTFYRDIAYLAFPTPPALRKPAELPQPRISSSFEGVDLTALSLTREPLKTINPVAASVESATQGWIQFDFPHPVTSRSVLIAGAPDASFPAEHRARVLASDDGHTFRDVVTLSTYRCLYSNAEAPVEHAIPVTTARSFRLVWDGPAKLELKRVIWSAEPLLTGLDGKVGEAGRTFVADPQLETEPGTAVPLASIQDVTSARNAQGEFCWTAPPGHWTVVRVGFRNTGKINEPAPIEARGLECDKFNREAVALHFENYVGRILKVVGHPNSGSSQQRSSALKGVLIDSWEARTQNWSPHFREEFQRRRGYDVVPYLAAFARILVEDRETTERFLRDVRQTGSDLVAENFYGVMRELSNRHGLRLSAEACGGSGPGTMVADGVQHYLHVDVPMTELNRPLKEAVSAAALTGKSVVALEAFTQGRANWNDSPASLKATGDAAFAAGINRMVFHTYAHNPEIDLLSPGPAFGKYGLPFSRGQTWWEMGSAWMTYLSRTQFLLQQGHRVADVLYFYGEDPAGPIAEVIGTDRQDLERWPALPPGYTFDLLPAPALNQMLSVKNKRLVLPHGASYRLLVLRNSDQLTLESVRTLRSLIAAGAVVVGPKPRRLAGLQGGTAAEAEIRKIGDEVWGKLDGSSSLFHRYGKGRVYWGKSVREVLQELEIAPDFQASSSDHGQDVDLHFTHRRSGETDLYFVANPHAHPVTVQTRFRSSRAHVERWDPATGKRVKIETHISGNHATSLSLTLAPFQSTFIVFRASDFPSSPAAAVSPRSSPLGGPWTVTFAGTSAPAMSLTLPGLMDWSTHTQDEVRFFSGTATYAREITWTPSSEAQGPVILDLGEVAVIAQVSVNGIDCGVVWTPPYRVEIQSALTAGKNRLEIRVANTWANRLMGDMRLPESQRKTWTTFHPYTDQSLPVKSGLLGPVHLITHTAHP